MRIVSTFLSLSFLIGAVFIGTGLAATPPGPGDHSPGFALKTLKGATVNLAELASAGPVALIVLRGYPGYQCPFCNRQVQDFVKNADAFLAAGVKVVMVYPGPPANLDARAMEAAYISNGTFPESFTMLLDPGYVFTNLYGLRWDAAGETAYPSAFLIQRGGTIFFSKVGKEHGGRITAEEVLEAVKTKGNR